MNQKIIEKRKEIKEEFEELLAEHASPFNFDHILDIINCEDKFSLLLLEKMNIIKP